MLKTNIIAIWAAFAFFGCRSGEVTNVPAEGEEHEEIMAQYVVWDDNFELFAEGPPFVAGEAASLTAYITSLPEFSPADSGVLSLSIITAANTVNAEAQYIRPGVYTAVITPEIAGSSSLSFELQLSGTNYILPPAGITVYENEEEAHEAAESGEHAEENTTVFTREQAWKSDFATGFATREPFGQVIGTTGIIQPASNGIRIINAPSDGIVLFNGNGNYEGLEVIAAQNLFTVTGTGLVDNNISLRYTEAFNNYEKARLNYERALELSEDKIISERELIEIKNEFMNAEALFNTLSRDFADGGQIVRSPVNGFISQVFTANGEYVQTGQPVLAVSDNSQLVIRADVQQKYAAVLGNITSAGIKDPVTGEVAGMTDLKGRILSYGKAANEGSPMLPVNIQIRNNGHFIPGGIVEVYLKTRQDNEALTVPNTALIEEQGIFYIYVQESPEEYEKREVKTGATDGLRTVVISGLSDDERIVTRGAVFVKLAQSAGALDPHAGHVH